MRVLSRYLVRELLKWVALCLMIFLIIYLMIDVASAMDDFIKAKAPRSAVTAYFLYKTPGILVQMLPVAVLTAVIILFSIMKRNNEVTALAGCGADIWEISRPVILTSLFLCAAMFLFSEMVVPYTSSHANEIWRVEVRKEKGERMPGQGHIWYKGENRIYWMRQFDSRTQTMIEPVFYFFDDAFHVVQRTEARTATWKRGAWELRNGMLQERDPDGTYNMRRFDRWEAKIPESPDDFVRQDMEPEEMGYHQLKRFAGRLTAEGYDATRYLVELHIKVAFPLVILVMVLMGIPVALWKKRMGTPVAVSIGIGICFLYLLVMGLSRTLGFAGVLPPFLSAWLANGLFLLLGLYLLMQVNR